MTSTNPSPDSSSSGSNPGPLKMARVSEAQSLSERMMKEQRIVNKHREKTLLEGLGPFRVGSVSYLNSAPLTRGLEDDIIYTTPSRLAAMLEARELDAALVSVVEVLYHEEYEILDSIAVASLGDVYSVILAHKKPLEDIRQVACDPASLTSVDLLKVILAEKGLHPEFVSLDQYQDAVHLDYVLLIGNPAIDFRRKNTEHTILDLGGAWYEMTGLPFVYAVWALRKGMDSDPLKTKLRDAKAFGMDTLDSIIHQRSEYDLEFRKDYLGWHIHYHLASDEKRGLAKFIELLRKHTDKTIYDPLIVS